MALTRAQLAAELTGDPEGIGYAPHVASGAHATLADLLNAPRAGIVVRRQDVSVAEIYSAIRVADYTPLPANANAVQLSTERRYLAWLSGLGALGGSVRVLNEDDTDTPIAENLRAMFPAASATWQRLVALARRDGSRAEQLGGFGTVVTPAEIALALNEEA
jgi:hypothetical protein